MWRANVRVAIFLLFFPFFARSRLLSVQTTRIGQQIVLIFVSVCLVSMGKRPMVGNKVRNKKQKINEIPQRKWTATEETMATRTPLKWEKLWAEFDFDPIGESIPLKLHIEFWVAYDYIRCYPLATRGT